MGMVNCYQKNGTADKRKGNKMKYALYAQSPVSGRWIRVAKAGKDCIYTSLEEALKDCERLAYAVEVVKVKNLTTKETVYQGSRP